MLKYLISKMKKKQLILGLRKVGINIIISFSTQERFSGFLTRGLLSVYLH